MFCIRIWGCLILLSTWSFAQLPSTDIYLVPFNPAGSQLVVGKAVNITDRVGYDNQPFFLPDGSLLYSSIRDDNQSDVYRYDPKTGKTTQVTKTPEHEYSPTLMPDGKHFSVIRQDAEGNQHLYQYSLDGSQSEMILKTINMIGYHTWLTPTKLGLFIVGQPHTLQFVNLGDEKPTVVLENIGRCLSMIPGSGDMSIVHKKAAHDWELVRVNGNTGAIQKLRNTKLGSEDYAWTPNGTLIMAQGRTVYRSTPMAEAAWQPLAEFDENDMQQINRLAVSPDGRMLAMVVSRR